MLMLFYIFAWNGHCCLSVALKVTTKGTAARVGLASLQGVKLFPPTFLVYDNGEINYQMLYQGVFKDCTHESSVFFPVVLY